MYFEDSSSSDSSEDETISALASVMVEKQKRVTITNYINSVVPCYSDEQFRQNVRLQRINFESLAVEFGNSTIYQNLLLRENSRCNITPEKHVLTFLWFAGHQTSSYRDVADRFDLSLSSLHDIITRILKFLNMDMLHKVIKFPTEEQKLRTKNYYSVVKGFPNVIGSIDGSHIKIDRPSERPTDYFNRKDYHSIILQGVCDENNKFIDIFVGYPGSVHDSRVFRNSTFYNSIATFCQGNHILGDSAYPLSQFLLTPYRDNGHLTAAQKACNIRLSSCRVSIEHALGLLKQRFRQLFHLKLKGPNRICEFITACCVLHNLAIDDKEPFQDVEKYVDNQPGTVPYCFSKVSAKDGNSIRDRICKELEIKNRLK